MHYNYHRYYDPAVGRYITSDPIGLAGGLNTYGYALQNPVRFIDPLGLKGGCPTGMAPDENNICRPYSGYDDPCVSWECRFYSSDTNTSKSNCNFECNIKYQPVCTGAGFGVGTLTTPSGGAIATGGCVLVKAVVCALVCDEDKDRSCPSEKR